MGSSNTSKSKRFGVVASKPLERELLKKHVLSYYDKQSGRDAEKSLDDVKLAFKKI